MQLQNDSCTTILVGKKASLNGSNLIARNEDGEIAVRPKKMILIDENSNVIDYLSRNSTFKIKLPSESLKYTSTPNANIKNGIWGESGINSQNVAMSATETITSNSRVLSHDPYVENGIGEEDFLTIVLPYISSAEEGVIRLGSLLEKYGTYEANGICFSDKNNIWWMETIGGHHWVATRIPDDAYVVATNRFNIDIFDFKSDKVKFSKGLEEFILKHKLNPNKHFYNLRYIFGSSSIKDTRYNNPRAWYIQKTLTSDTNKLPIDQDFPFICYPDRKISIEDIKWCLSSHYQNTPYDPYDLSNTESNKIFRPIALNRNNEIHILEIIPEVSSQMSGVHWIGFGPNTFNFIIPFFSNVKYIPDAFSNTNEKYNLNHIYWLSLTTAVIGDSDYAGCNSIFKRYEEKLMALFRKNIIDARHLYTENDEYVSLEKINQKNAKIYLENSFEMLGEMVKYRAENMILKYNMTDV